MNKISSLLSLLLITGLFSLSTVHTADKAAWKSKAVYQLLTDRFARTNGDKSACSNLGKYCGGTFVGIQNNLDYIVGMGFDAIWISPVVTNYDQGYHGYWATDWNSINPKFGTAQELKNLVNACHAKGLWVMVDVVANHVGPVGSDYTQINPYNKAEHYHSNCQINDWNNQQQVENCRLADLPDLNQDGNTWVASTLKTWVKTLVSTYGFDGIRIDTIPEVPKSFWTDFCNQAGVFQMGECFNGNVGYVADYQKYVQGLFNYPMYYTIKDVWMYGKSMYTIRDRYNEETPAFQDMDALGVFVDNHDNSRFLNSQGDRSKFKSAIVFSLTSRGIPFFYYGDEQYYAGGNDPNNREPLWTNMNTGTDMYTYVKQINAARKKYSIWGQQQIERYIDDNFYAFSRGSFFVALTNIGGTVSRSVTYHPYADGQVVCNIFYPTSDCVTVTGGILAVTLMNGEAKIFVPKTTMNDDSIINEEEISY